MPRKHRLWMTLFGLFTAASLLLSACGTPSTPTTTPTAAPAEPTQAPQAQPTQAPQEQPTQAPQEPTAVPTAAAETPKEGGKLVIAITAEPPTLDPEKASGDVVLFYLGAALVAKDKDNQYVPWLAKSWELSPDGKTWTFKLRDDVKFTDGTPLTAKDFVYTFQRAVDPATASPVSGQMLTSIAKIEAPDDTTLVISLKEPMAPFMDNLVAAGFLTPLSQTWVEKEGDNFGRNPMSVGPFKLKEWVTGDHITLERNPDYVWQPAYAQNQGPYHIQEIEFRIIPETATIIAGLEAGEIDYAYGIEPQYVERVQGTNKYQMLTTYLAGAYPYGVINVAKPPFDDLKVRQAFEYAIDRQALIDIVQNGNATIQYGPISPPTTGYWEGVEQIGYHFDLEKAKSLFAEAGYTAGSDGMLAKDGKPLKVSFMVSSDFIKDAQVLVEQLKSAGVQLDLKQVEFSNLVTDVVSGNYEMSILGYQWPNYDILYLVYNSKQEGVLNLDHVKDPDLDKLLETMRAETDPAKQQQAVEQAQQRIVEQAYMIPLYDPKTFFPLSTKVKGAYLSQKNNILYLEDAWIE